MNLQIILLISSEIKIVLRVQFSQCLTNGWSDGSLAVFAAFDFGQQLACISSSCAEGGHQSGWSRIHFDDSFRFFHGQAIQLHQLLGEHVRNRQRLHQEAKC